MKDVNGLQINNLFVADTQKEKNVVFSIQTISTNGVTANGTPFRIFNIEDIRPLNITTKALGLLEGFDKKIPIVNIGRLNLIYPKNQRFQIVCNGDTIATPKYIHELQNIVSSLTGEYLQLKN
jgi:hypothetical protein